MPLNVIRIDGAEIIMRNMISRNYSRPFAPPSCRKWRPLRLTGALLGVYRADSGMEFTFPIAAWPPSFT